MINNATEQHYKVKDLYQASFLVASGQKLKGLEKEENFYWFLFSDPEICKQLSDDYFLGNGMVNVRNYVNSFKGLKDVLFARRGETMSRKGE